MPTEAGSGHYGAYGETFAECVAKASSWSDNPEGFCNWVHQQTEGGPPGSEDTKKDAADDQPRVPAGQPGGGQFAGGGDGGGAVVSMRSVTHTAPEVGSKLTSDRNGTRETHTVVEHSAKDRMMKIRSEKTGEEKWVPHGIEKTPGWEHTSGGTVSSATVQAVTTGRTPASVIAKTVRAAAVTAKPSVKEQIAASKERTEKLRAATAELKESTASMRETRKQIEGVTKALTAKPAAPSLRDTTKQLKAIVPKLTGLQKQAVSINKTSQHMALVGPAKGESAEYHAAQTQAVLVGATAKAANSGAGHEFAAALHERAGNLAVSPTVKEYHASEAASHRAASEAAPKTMTGTAFTSETPTKTTYTHAGPRRNASIPGAIRRRR